MAQKTNLFGLTLDDLQHLCKNENLPKFTAKQIADWLYKKRSNSIDDMTNMLDYTWASDEVEYLEGEVVQGEEYEEFYLDDGRIWILKKVS